ncbi:MAG: GNAT family N-acetyltransferase [Micromonosporaceae bacterium]|nr:GNAT family N-acetyltransferase [Micromonosporaceae bacterium]
MSAGHPTVMITRSARDGERISLSYALAAAFLETPLARWLIPDRDARRARLPRYAEIWIDHGLAHGVVEVAETAEGALAGLAIWQPEPGPEPKRYQQRLAEAVGHEHLPRFDSLDTALRLGRPRQPHLYLACCAVPPAYQSQGYGAALIRRRHTDIDGSKTPAHLVAASAEARRFFLRYGYGDHGDPIALPEGPRLFPMTRHPAAELPA